MAKHLLIVFPGYELMCFLDTKVAYQQIVVMPTNKLCPDTFRDVGKALVVQNPIDVVPALLAKLLVGLLIGFQLPGLVVFILKFL